MNKHQTCLTVIREREINLKKQNHQLLLEFEKCNDQASSQFDEFPIGHIAILSMTINENAREIDFCTGISTKFGYFTSSLCCQADEMFLFDAESSVEIIFDSYSISLEEHICFINTTQTHEFQFPNSNYVNLQNCSILVFDPSVENFKNQQFELDISKCIDSPCPLKINSTSVNSIFNGTSVVCHQSKHFGIITKSKSSIFIILKQLSF